MAGGNSSRQRRVPLDRAGIVAAAEAVAKRVGLENVTVRAVCDELGVTPPTIYWHVRNKSDLLHELVDGIAASIPRPAADSGTWFERLVRYQVAMRDGLLAYPGVATHLVRELPSEANISNSLFIYELLVEGGFNEEQAMSMFTALSVYVMGDLMVTDAVRLRRGAPQRGAIDDAVRRRIAAIADRPELRAFVESLARIDPRRGREQFHDGLEALVRGMAIAAGITDLPAAPVSV